MAKIVMENLFKVFGPRENVQEAISLAKDGEAPEKISDKTGCTVAVNDATFTVDGPEIFVIMGLSGSGKSTMLRCINRLIEPTEGYVAIDGENVQDMDNKSILKLREKKLAMVFQHFGLLEHKNVIENAAFGLELRGVSREEREKKAEEILDLVGLKEYATASVGELSGGMRQRVGLARALATEADVLLMDEAFSALDPLIRSQMQSEFLELQEKMPKTILFITHDLGEALALGDRIAIMKDGKIVQIGSPERIVLHPEDEYVESFVENVDRSRVLKIETVADNDSPKLSKSDSVEKAVDEMKNYGSSFVPVIEDDRLAGFVWLEDAYKERDTHDPRLENIVRSAPGPVAPGDRLIAVFKRATTEKSPLPVLDEDGVFKGVVTKEILLKAIAGGER